MIGFEQIEYNTTEAAGSVTVTVAILQGRLEGATASVAISTLDSTATGM